MSQILYTGDKTGLHVSRYVGPEIGVSIKEKPWTGDRRRYQITTLSGMLIMLSRGEFLDLAEFFLGNRGAWDGS